MAIALEEALNDLDEVLNAFCPTGEGGGVDPSCSPTSGGLSSIKPSVFYEQVIHPSISYESIKDYVRGLKKSPLERLTTEAKAMGMSRPPASKKKLLGEIERFLIDRKEGWQRTSWGKSDSQRKAEAEAQMSKKGVPIPKLATNAFCPTGEGGGQDNSCSPKGSSTDTTGVDPEIKSLMDRATVGIVDAGLSEAQGKSYASHLKTVLGRLSNEVIARVEFGVKKFKFYRSPEELTQREAQIDPEVADALKGSPDARILGAYNIASRTAHLDGAREGQDDDKARGVYAHELYHAVDGPANLFSNRTNWKQAWAKEIQGGKLSDYATVDQSEGFAEFGRYLTSDAMQNNAARVEAWKNFPASMGFFYAHKFLPRAFTRNAEEIAAERTTTNAAKAVMKDIFTRAVSTKLGHYDIYDSETGDVVNALRSLDIALNSNPEGCNQYTGPGCSGSSGNESGEGGTRRFGRTRNVIHFDNPIKGPSGAKLTDYEWKYYVEKEVDDRGEDVTRRYSDWDEAKENPETGRQIVHHFAVETAEGKTKTVSLESAMELLGYTKRDTSAGAKQVKSIASTVKSRAKAQMELDQYRSVHERLAKSIDEAKGKVGKLPRPQIQESEEVGSSGGSYRKVYTMGDSKQYVFIRPDATPREMQEQRDYGHKMVREDWEREQVVKHIDLGIIKEANQSIEASYASTRPDSLLRSLGAYIEAAEKRVGRLDKKIEATGKPIANANPEGCNQYTGPGCSARGRSEGYLLEDKELVGKIHPTNTPQFKRWFGKSKIVDDAGKPLVVYHGTTAPEDFDKFNVGEPVYSEDENYERTGSGNDPTTYLGSHFAKEVGVAEKFAKGLYGERQGVASGNRIMPVYLKIEKPYVVDESKMQDEMKGMKLSSDFVDYVLEERSGGDSERHRRLNERYEKSASFRRDINDLASQKEMEGDEPSYEVVKEMADKYQHRLRSLGYDGIAYQNEMEGGTSYVVFDSNQVKSAMGNRGTFSSDDPIITHAFCPTGPGGGQDNSCSPVKSGGEEKLVRGRAPHGATVSKDAGGATVGSVKIDEYVTWNYRHREEFKDARPGSEVRPEEIDGEHERQAIQTAVSAAREFWSDGDKDAKYIRKLDDVLVDPIDTAKAKFGIMSIYTLNPKDYGAGSGGPGGVKVFWGPYSAPDRKERLTNENKYCQSNSLGVDPMFVLGHEIHHAYGYHSELDTASDVVGVLAHLRSGLRFNPAAAAYKVQDWALLLNCDKKKYRTQSGRILRYLNSKDSSGLKKLMTTIDVFGEPMYSEKQWGEIMAQVPDRAKGK